VSVVAGNRRVQRLGKLRSNRYFLELFGFGRTG